MTTAQMDAIEDLKEENAKRGLTLATLCDMVLGEDAEDRSDEALIRRVRELLNKNTALVKSISLAKDKLQATQYNWREECLFDCNDILENALKREKFYETLSHL